MINQIKDVVKLSMPFSAIGAAFLLIALIHKDSLQLNFGFVWLAIAIFAIIYRKTKRRNL